MSITNVPETDAAASASAPAVGGRGIQVSVGSDATFDQGSSELHDQGCEFTFGYFEQLKVPRHLLDGHFYSALCDDYGVYPTSIIDINKPFSVKWHWQVEGPLAKCLCGYWCINAHFESQGPGPEPDLKELYGKHIYVPYEPCGTGEYWVEVTFPPDSIPTDVCSSLYRLSTSLTYHTVCPAPGPHHDFQPGGMAGHADLGLVQFYESH
jgi:hypothetical protein